MFGEKDITGQKLTFPAVITHGRKSVQFHVGNDIRIHLHDEVLKLVHIFNLIDSECMCTCTNIVLAWYAQMRHDNIDVIVKKSYKLYYRHMQRPC